MAPARTQPLPPDPAEGPDDPRAPRRIADYLGGPWVWVAVALFAVIGLSIRFAAQPSTSKSGSSTTVVSIPASLTSAGATTQSSNAPATTIEPSTPSTTGPGGNPDTAAPTTTLHDTGVWTMPRLIDEKLDAAKDAIAELTDGAPVPVLVRDASGENRRQIIHQNWKVCAQSPGAGGTFTVEAGVILDVVKNGETCPAGGI